MVDVRNAQLMPTAFILDHITFRSLEPEDIPALQKLCHGWFPVEYPNSWYEDITSGSNAFFTVAAVYDGYIIGSIVAEIKYSRDLNKEVKF